MFISVYRYIFLLFIESKGFFISIIFLIYIILYAYFYILSFKPDFNYCGLY